MHQHNHVSVTVIANMSCFYTGFWIVANVDAPYGSLCVGVRAVLNVIVLDYISSFVYFLCDTVLDGLKLDVFSNG